MQNAPIIKNNNTSKFQAVRVVEAPAGNIKQGLSKIAKDENGLISTTKVEFNPQTNQWLETVELTSKSLHRALVENITSSNIEAINVIFRDMIRDAQEQADTNTFDYVQGLVGNLNNVMADYKQQAVNIQKDYAPRVAKASVWDNEIDIYNMGQPITSSMGGEETVDIEVEEDEDYTGVAEI